MAVASAGLYASLVMCLSVLLYLNCVAAKVDGIWQKKTFKDYYDDVIAAAKSLIEVCCGIAVTSV